MEEQEMFGFDNTIRVTCMICGNTFPVNAVMVDPNDDGWQYCGCSFCKRETDV